MTRIILLIPLIVCTSITGMSAQCPVTANAGPDKYLCAPATTTMLSGSVTGPPLSVYWTPSTGLNNANILTPTATVTGTTTYTLHTTAIQWSDNLIVNGDFESGNTGFTTAYTYTPGNIYTEGAYDIIPNPNNSHPDFAPCTDHTAAPGTLMMVINGTGTPNTVVWCQTVPVTPNTQYAFSTWATSVVSSSPAVLQIFINGVQVGTTTSLSSATCNWTNLTAMWSSGGATSASICIVNQNTALSGNDFAMDDFVFAPSCETTDEMTVHVINLTATASPIQYTLPCEGSPITLSAVNSSSGPNITYNWYTLTGNIVSGGNTLTPVVDEAGIYNLSVIYSDGNITCTKTASVQVLVDPNALTVSIFPPGQLGCDPPEITISALPNQPNNQLSFSWNTLNGNIVTGGNSSAIVVDAAGTYTVMVTNNINGCTSAASVVVTANAAYPTAIATGSAIGCINPNTLISGAGSSIGAGFMYEWTTNDGIIVTGANGLFPTVGSPGTYTLTVLNPNNGCSASDTAIVVSNAGTPMVSIVPPDPIDCFSALVVLAGSVSPANATYAWTATNGGIIQSGGNTLFPVVATAGTYHLIATNPLNGCQDTATAVVISNTTPPIAVASVAGTLDCGNNSIAVYSTGSSSGPGFQFQWTTIDGHIASGQNSATATVDQPGSYVLTVSNINNGCTASDSVQVMLNQSTLIANATASGVITCLQSQVTLSGAGSSTGIGLSYMWTTSNGTIFSGANTLSPVVTSAGIYQLLVSDSGNGCSATASVAVTADLTPPSIAISPPAPITCTAPTGAMICTFFGGSSFSWVTVGGGNIVSGANTATPAYNSPGGYCVTLTNTTNGCIDTACTTVSANTAVPLALATSTDTINCQQASVQVFSTGSSSGTNITYHWTAISGNVSGGDHSATATVNAAGSYILEVTDTINGCSDTSWVSVPADTSAVVAVANAPGQLDCDTDMLTLNANGSSGGSVTYAWTTPNGAIESGAGTPTPVVSAPGSYVLLLQHSASGCASTDTIQVIADMTPPVVVAFSPDSLGCNTGTVVLSSAGSSMGPSFAYHWTTLSGNITAGDDAPDPVVSAAGEYTLVVTNTTNGCSASATTTVVADANIPVAAILSPSGALNCAVGTLTLDAGASSSGFGYVYAWTGGNILSGADGLSPVVNAAGTYTLTVTNTQNQCSATAQTVVGQDTTAPAILPIATGTITCSDPTYLLQGQIGNPASGPMTFLWETMDGNLIGDPSLTAVPCDAAGTYAFTVVNTGNQCSVSAQVVIDADTASPVISIAPPAIITCALSQVTLDGTADAGMTTWNWTTAGGGNIVSGHDTPQPIVNAPGDYTAVVVNTVNGCSASAQVTVGQNAAFPAADAGSPAVLNCFSPALTLSGNGDMGADITYLWQTADGNIVSGEQTLTPLVDGAGIYTLYVSNLTTGCTGSAAVQITADLAPPFADAGMAATLDCGTASIYLDGSQSDSGPAYTYSWTTANGNILGGQNSIAPEVNAPGTYTLTVLNTLNGCSQTASVGVVQDANAPQADAGLPDTLTCSIQQLSLQATASQGPEISYNWVASGGGNILSGGQTLQPVVDAPGQYILNVLDSSNGCQTLSSVLIAENIALPEAVAGTSQLLTCSVQQTVLQGSTDVASGNYSAFWSTVDGHIVAGANTLTPLIDASGTYTISITDLGNGCAATGMVFIPIDTAAPQIAAIAGSSLTCTLEQTPLNGALVVPLTDYSTLWTAGPGGVITGPADALIATAVEPGIYTFTVINLFNGCIQSTDVEIFEDITPPVADAGTAGILTCLATTATLDGSGSSAGATFTYVWTAIDGSGIVSGAGTPTPVIDEPGLYELLVTNLQNGCTSASQVAVDIDADTPAALIAPPDPLTCIVTTTPLDAGGSAVGSDISLYWTDPLGQPFTPADPYLVFVPAAGQYTLLVTNSANGCTATASAVVVSDQSAPLADAGPSFALHCQQTQVELQGSSDATDAAFSWSTANGLLLSGALSAMPLVGQAGQYQVEVTDLSNGCIATDIVVVTEIPLPEFDLQTIQPHCLNPTGAAVIDLAGGGTPPYLYGLEGMYQQAPIFAGLAPGVYTVSVLDANGCETLQSAVIETPFELVLTLDHIHTIPLGESYQLNPVLNLSPGQVSTWEWSPAEGLSCVDCPSPVASPLQGMTYAVTVTDTNGCTATALTQLIVKADRDIFAPNIFSPNGDGINDHFTLYGQALTQIQSLQIYDRWGNQLYRGQQFSPNDPQQGWDGRYQDKPLLPGVYAWYAEVVFIDGLVLLFKGDVTLL